MQISFYFAMCHKVGRYSSVSTELLRAGRSEDRITEGARYFVLAQTGPGAHSSSYTMDTRSFPETKRPGRGVYHPSPSNPEIKENVELCIYSLYGALWPFLRRNSAHLLLTQYSARLIKVCTPCPKKIVPFFF